VKVCIYYGLRIFCKRTSRKVSYHCNYFLMEGLGCVKDFYFPSLNKISGYAKIHNILFGW